MLTKPLLSNRTYTITSNSFYLHSRFGITKINFIFCVAHHSAFTQMFGSKTFVAFQQITTATEMTFSEPNYVLDL